MDRFIMFGAIIVLSFLYAHTIKVSYTNKEQLTELRSHFYEKLTSLNEKMTYNNKLQEDNNIRVKEIEEKALYLKMNMPRLQEKGIATWYAGKINVDGRWIGDEFENKMTASGEEMTNDHRTCAHRSLQFGTIVWILNTDNNKSSWCKVNDRGPFGATIAGKDGKVERVIKLTETDPGNWDLILDANKKVADELSFTYAGSAQVILFY